MNKLKHSHHGNYIVTQKYTLHEQYTQLHNTGSFVRKITIHNNYPENIIEILKENANTIPENCTDNTILQHKNHHFQAAFQNYDKETYLTKFIKEVVQTTEKLKQN